MPKLKKVNTDTLAVFVCDPGETTGVGGGFYVPKGTLKKTLTEGRLAHKTQEVRGDYLKQGREIATLMMRFQYTANVERGISLENVHFVFEDFVLRRRRAGGATGNLTSCWVAASATALYTSAFVYLDSSSGQWVANKREIVWQQPSEGMFYKDRLHDFDLWVPGSEHERVVNMHLACRVSKLLG